MSLLDTNEEVQDKINNKYDKIKLLGIGAHGKAYLCQNVSINKQCVIKQIQLNQMNEQELQKQYKEVSILKSLNHSHIISYQDSFMCKKNYLCIVMDYAEGGDLEQRISQAQKTNTYFENKTILKWFTQLCSAVRFIHNQKIIHRDIKNNNIFLDSQDNILLGDFGISKKLSNLKDKANTFIGTPYFMAPEQCNQQAYTNKVDIWALGVVLFRLVYLKYPFEGFEIFHLMLAISKGTLNFPSTPSSPFKNIITKLLQNDPNRRPSIEQVFEFDEIRSYLEKSRLEKQSKSQCRLNSGRITRIIRDNNSGQLELESNRPSSPFSKNIQKSEQKLFEFAVQNYNSGRKIVQPPLSRNQSRDISPGMLKNLNTPKLPSLKQNSNALLNFGSQQKVYANFKSSPNIQKIAKGLKLNPNSENDKNLLNHQINNINNNHLSPKRLNKQNSECSTSESSNKDTPKVFLFNNNKVEEESPVIGVKKVLRNNLISKYPEGQVSSSSNNNPFSSQSSQARLKFSAKKYNYPFRRSEQIGQNIHPFCPSTPANQDSCTFQSAQEPKIHAGQQLQQQQIQQHTPSVIIYKQQRSDKQTRPSLHLQQHNSDNYFNNQSSKNAQQQQQQHKEAGVIKAKNRLIKEVQSNKQSSQSQQLIPLVFKSQSQKSQEPETFQEALQDYQQDQEFEQHEDQQMTCSINTVISQDFLKNSSRVSENASNLKNNSNVYNSNQNCLSNNNSNLHNNNGSSLFNNAINNNNNNNGGSNFNIQSNHSCSNINSNGSNSYSNNNNLNNNQSNNLISNNSNLFFNNNSHQFNNNSNNNDNIFQAHKNSNALEVEDILDNSFNDRCSSCIESEEGETQHNTKYFDDINLVVSYNYTKSTLSSGINSIMQSNYLKEEEKQTNTDEIIENLKDELMNLLGEELYFKISYYAVKLIQHYDINKIINENLMKKQFITMYTNENKKSIHFDADSVILNLLKIVDYEENYSMAN